MDRGELHTLRVLVPGIMIALLALTLVEPSISIIQTLKDLDFGDLSGIGVAVVVGGALYTVFDARYRLTGFSWKSILDNIASRLLEILRNTRDVSEGQEKFLRDRRRLVDVFYRLLD